LIDRDGVVVDLADSDTAIVEKNSAFPFRHWLDCFPEVRLELRCGSFECKLGWRDVQHRLLICLRMVAAVRYASDRAR
jgi:hypothetical protein